MKIISTVPRGSGALVLHKELERSLSNYQVHDYSPAWELCPPAMRFIGRGKADLLHGISDYGVCTHRRNVPQVLTMHGYNLDPAGRSFSSAWQWLHYATDLRWFTRRSLMAADRVVAVSRFTARLASRDLGLEVDFDVIPNGVDTQRFHPQSDSRAQGRVKVLYCGNLSRRKGADLLPGIAARLGTGIRLQVASGLRSTALLESSDNIDFIGRIAPAQMPELYAQADILLVPSRREGLSLTLLEGMACGLPVVATDAASFPEAVHVGKGGYLCPEGDIDGFATRLNQLAGDARLRLQMGGYNRAVALSDYSLSRMVSSYRQLFERVCDEFTRR